MLKNSLSSFIVTILATILSFFVSVLLSHKLNVVDFGIVQFYLSSVLFMSVISRLGFDLIFIKYWKEYDSFKKQDLIFITSIVILFTFYIIFFTFLLLLQIRYQYWSYNIFIDIYFLTELYCFLLF